MKNENKEKLVVVSDGIYTKAIHYYPNGKKVVGTTIRNCVTDQYDFVTAVKIASTKAEVKLIENNKAKTPTEEKKLYNAKVVCLSNMNGIAIFDVGKIYEIKDGLIVFKMDDGRSFNVGITEAFMRNGKIELKKRKIRNFRDLVESTACEWIEVKE